MFKSKWMRLAFLAGGTLFALGGCAVGKALPYIIGAGLFTTLFNQAAA